MIHLITSEFRKLWGKRTFWIMLLALAGLQLCVLFYQNSQAEQPMDSCRELDTMLSTMTEEEKALVKEAEGFIAKFDEAMDDDFNTADAIAAIFELVKFANQNADAAKSKEFLKALSDEIKMLSDICGLIVEKEEEMLDSDIEKLIEERQNARKNKDFKRADEIRDELLNKGIILEDTREGVKWKRA